MSRDSIDSLIDLAKRDGFAKLSPSSLRGSEAICEQDLMARCAEEESKCEVLYLVETAVPEKQRYRIALWSPSLFCSTPHTPPAGAELAAAAAAAAAEEEEEGTTIAAVSHNDLLAQQNLNPQESQDSIQPTRSTVYAIRSTESAGNIAKARSTLRPLLLPASASENPPPPRLQPRGGIQLRGYPLRTRKEVEDIAARGAAANVQAAAVAVAAALTSPNTSKPATSYFAPSSSVMKREPDAVATTTPSPPSSPPPSRGLLEEEKWTSMKKQPETKAAAEKTRDPLSTPGSTSHSPSNHPTPLLMERIQNALDELPPKKQATTSVAVVGEGENKPQVEDNTADAAHVPPHAEVRLNADNAAQKPSTTTEPSSPPPPTTTPSSSTATAGAKTQRQVSLFDWMASAPKRAKTENLDNLSAPKSATGSTLSAKKEPSDAEEKTTSKKKASVEKAAKKKAPTTTKAKKEITQTASKSLTKLARASGKSAKSAGGPSTATIPSSANQFLDDDNDDNCFEAEDGEPTAEEEEVRLYQEMQAQESSCFALDVTESHENDDIILCDDTPPFVFVSENTKETHQSSKSGHNNNNNNNNNNNKLPVPQDPNGLKNFFHPAVLEFQKSFKKAVETEMKVIDGEYICNEVVVYRCEASGETLSQEEFHRRSSAIAATAASQDEEAAAAEARRSDELQRSSAGHSSMAKPSIQTVQRPVVSKRVEPQEVKGLAFFFGKK